MSLYSEYALEREDIETLEIPQGFVTYKITGDEAYIKDIYVKSECRKDGYASRLADQISEIAKGRGCHWLIGSVSPAANGSHASMLVLIAYGMRLTRADKDIIYFSKRIK